MRYKIISTGEQIIADASFVEQYHPNDYELVIPEVTVPVVPEPTVRYKALTKLEFVRLLISNGGATQQTIVAAKNDAALEYFWLVFDMAQELKRDDPELQEGLEALLSLGYITDKQAVLDNWTTE